MLGLTVSGLNHALHSGDGKGYELKGNKVNDKGGDTTDYMHDKDGNSISSTSVEFKGAISGSGSLRG